MFKPIIRKALALLLPMLVSAAMFAATTNKVVTLNFSEDMFKINIENGVVQEIIYTKDVAPLPSDTTMPALPIVPFTVSAGPNIDCTFTPTIASKKLILENVDVATAPQILPTSMMGKVTPTPRGRYTGPLYPAQICTLNGKSEWSDVTYLHFSCSPFIYDAQARKLYLIEQLDVDITATEHLSRAKLAAASTHRMTPKPSFIRPPLDSLLRPGIDSSKFIEDTVIGPGFISDEIFTTEYVIITSEALKPAFEPLLRWKRTKGLTTQLYTVEQISKSPNGKDLPAKIKNHLRPDPFNLGIKYVLLGGDDTVVPVRYCERKCWADRGTDTPIYSLPTDLYYTCLNDPYDWDRNGNGIYGEYEDTVSYTPSFAVTRLPVRTPSEVETVVNRTIEYECSPRWHNNLLFAGTDMEKSDKPIQFYNTFFKRFNNYWSGTKEELLDIRDWYHNIYDTVFVADSLYNRIAMGYNFISIRTHGGPQCFLTKTIGQGGKDGFYTCNHAKRQTNNAHTIITTSACYTNAFQSMDKNSTQDPNVDSLSVDPCLSEAFIRNPNSGVIGYLGCSHFSLFSGSSVSGAASIEANFYKNLFSGTHQHFGEAATDSRFSVVSKVVSYNWEQFAFNIVGDPEMPVFTEEPQTFNRVQTTIDNKNRCFEIATGELNCTICIQGIGGSDYYKRSKNVPVLSAQNLPDQFTVCVTKQNFIPWIYGFNRQLDGTYRMTELTYDNILQENFGMQPILGQITNVKQSIYTPSLYDITTLVSDSGGFAYLKVYNINMQGGYTINRYAVKSGESTTSIDVRYVSGTNMLSLDRVVVVELVVNGIVQDTKKIML